MSKTNSAVESDIYWAGSAVCSAVRWAIDPTIDWDVDSGVYSTVNSNVYWVVDSVVCSTVNSDVYWAIRREVYE